MTGFGRGQAFFEQGHITLEIQSVNRKHLEIHLHLPKILHSYEIELRQAIALKIQRGQITVRSNIFFSKGSPYAVKVNAPLAQEIKKGWDQLAAELQIKDQFKLDYLIGSDVIQMEMEESLRGSLSEALLAALKDALVPFDEMRDKEGEFIEQDFQGRIKAIKEQLDVIEAKKDGASKKWGEKLLSKIVEVVHTEEIDERILREIALYAERIDITEECVRFRSHLQQFEKEKKGKSLEFILQELGREINTIGSKAQEYEVSKAVIEVKKELEKLREQVQNVE